MPLPIPDRYRLHAGGSWTRQARDDPNALVTLVAFDPTQAPDADGRRPGDTNVGTVKSAELARLICDQYNEARDRYQGSLGGGLTGADGVPQSGDHVVYTGPSREPVSTWASRTTVPGVVIGELEGGGTLVWDTFASTTYTARHDELTVVRRATSLDGG